MKVNYFKAGTYILTCGQLPPEIGQNWDPAGAGPAQKDCCLRQTFWDDPLLLQSLSVLSSQSCQNLVLPPLHGKFVAHKYAAKKKNVLKKIRSCNRILFYLLTVNGYKIPSREGTLHEFHQGTPCVSRYNTHFFTCQYGRHIFPSHFKLQYYI